LRSRLAVPLNNELHRRPLLHIGDADLWLAAIAANAAVSRRYTPACHREIVHTLSAIGM
jgi:hypothetical protein